MQPINFFDDGIELPKARADVRLKNLGLFVYDDARRVAVGFEMTPFRERPSLEITATNARGDLAGSMTVIEALSPNFSLTMHLRDQNPTELYEIDVVVYYDDEEGEPLQVDRRRGTIDVTRPGDQTAWTEEE